MKKLLLLLISTVFILSFSACSEKSSQTMEITADNYMDYFTVTTKAEVILPELETNGNGAILVTPKSTKIKIKVTVDRKKEMNTDSVIIKGIIDLPQKYWGRLHEQGELPIETVIYVDSNGHGEFEGEILDLLYFSNGYSEDDFFFECNSVSEKSHN